MQAHDGTTGMTSIRAFVRQLHCLTNNRGVYNMQKNRYFGVGEDVRCEYSKAIKLNIDTIINRMMGP